MTIKEKYLELRKKNLWIEKIIDTCSPTLKTDQNLAHTSRCLKEEISHKMCWIFHETLPIWLPIRCPLKKIVYASRKVLKICLRASKRWLILSDSVRCPSVLICLLINTSAPSHWLKSVAWPVGLVLKFRDIPDCLSYLKLHRTERSQKKDLLSHLK